MKHIFIVIACFLLTSVVYAQHKNANLLIEDINFIDVETGQVFPNTNILIQDGKIAAISKPGKKLNAHEDIKTVDGRGQWACPGLIDANVNLSQSGGLYSLTKLTGLSDNKSDVQESKEVAENMENTLRRYTLNGITSVIDFSGIASTLNIKEKFKSDYKIPNIYLTGTHSYSPNSTKLGENFSLNKKSIDTPEQYIEKQLVNKADAIKIWYTDFEVQTKFENHELVKLTIKEAHKAGLRVIVNVPELRVAKLAVAAGADILWNDVDSIYDEEFLSAIKFNKVVFISCQKATNNHTKAFRLAHRLSQYELENGDPFVIGTVTDLAHIKENGKLKSYKTVNDNLADSHKRKAVQNARNLKSVSEKGITIAVGSGAGNIGTIHGASFYPELLEMKKAGLPNIEIVKSATINGAKVIGAENKIGSIKVGKNADIIILNKNPYQDLSAFSGIEKVIKDGHLVKTKYLFKDTPEILAQKQLNAYNAQNIDAFLEPYSDNVEIFEFPNKSIAKGKTEMRKMYTPLFENTPDLHCQVVKRIVQGNTVIDQEIVTGRTDGKTIEETAIYKIVNNKIAKVYFISK